MSAPYGGARRAERVLQPLCAAGHTSCNGHQRRAAPHCRGGGDDRQHLSCSKISTGTPSTRMPSLKQLAASRGTLSPQFSAAVLELRHCRDPEVSSLDLLFAPSQAGAAVSVNGIPQDAEAAAAAVELRAGINVVTIAVVALDDVTTQMYTIRIAACALAQLALSAAGEQVVRRVHKRGLLMWPSGHVVPASSTQPRSCGRSLTRG